MPPGNFTFSKMCSGAPKAVSLCMHTYIPASCHLRLAVSDQKVRHTGLASRLQLCIIVH